MKVPEKASCWICRRTKLEIDDYYHSVIVDGELPKWLSLDHIIPLNPSIDKIDRKKCFYICPFCREATIQIWCAKFLGAEKANK